MKDKELVKSFRMPPATFRAKPFWAWNGELEKEELFWQIHMMKEMGFGGFFMHSRTGLKTEYLGDKWFRLINDCVDEAVRIGLEAWIYDEDRWPSGIAGGLVTQEKACRAKFIEMRIICPGTSMEYSKETVAAFACKIEGDTFRDLREIGKEEDPENEYRLIFSIIESEYKDVYNGYTYLDTMNADATAKFIEMTHEKYKEKSGDRIGTGIRGIFTDEPHRGAMFSTFSEGNENRAPYTEQLFPAFLLEYGYDLKKRLPFLFLRPAGEKFSKTALDYVEICQKLFLDNFAKPIQKWCSENNMIFTGHLLHEDSLSAQTVMQGSLMQFYEYMDYPGIDILTEKNDCWWVVKQVVSIAKQLGRPFILSEMYGGTGWQMSLENYKQTGDWQALFGVNLRCPHLAWYTMQGEAKRDYPASIFYQSAWHKDYEQLESYFARVGVFTSQGENDCRLLVLNPIESVWGYSRSGAFCGLEAADERIQYLEKRYQETFHTLVRGHIEFDYGEEAILKKYGKVKDNRLYVGECSYDKVLVTGMDEIRERTLEILEEFQGQGGTVIFAGELPKYLDGIPSGRIEEAAGKCIKSEYSKRQILKLCRNGKEIQIEGNGNEDILCRTSSDNEILFVMLLNSNRDTEYRNIIINFGPACRIEQWDARTGDIKELPGIHDNTGILTVDFAPGEEKLYRIVKPLVDKCIPKQLRYELSEENILVLDMVEVDIEDRQYCDEVLKADRKIREDLGIPIRGGEMLQPWFARKYNRGQYEKQWDARLNYKFHIRAVPDCLYLVYEDKKHVKEVLVNGNDIEYNSENYWIDTCFTRVKVPGLLLKEGINEVTIHYGYCQENGLEAIYLTGAFGVFFHSDLKVWELSQLPEFIETGDVCTQGFPFYSGSIKYFFPNMEGVYQIQNLKASGACIKVVGDTEKILFAPPYICEMKDPKEIEVTFTRRNTFGPLHCTEKKRPAYGPEAFMTDHEEWQDDYSLIEQGLLEAPEFQLISK